MTKRFRDPVGQPYLRYRKFVNICALKIVSQNNGVSDGNARRRRTDRVQLRRAQPGHELAPRRSATRSPAMQAQTANLPASFMVDWHAIMLNNSEWWNTGAALDVLVGRQPGRGRRGRARRRPRLPPARRRILQRRHRLGLRHRQRRPRAATELEPGQHDQQRSHAGDKWPMWMGYTQAGATGLQGTFSMGSGPVPPVGELDDEQPVRQQRQHQLQLRVAREDDHGHLAQRRADRLDGAGRRARSRTRRRSPSTSSTRRSSTSTGRSTAPSSPRRAARRSRRRPRPRPRHAHDRREGVRQRRARPGAPDDRHQLRPHELGALGADGDLDGEHSLSPPARGLLYVGSAPAAGGAGRLAVALAAAARPRRGADVAPATAAAPPARRHAAPGRRRAPAPVAAPPAARPRPGRARRRPPTRTRSRPSTSASSSRTSTSRR